MAGLMAKTRMLKHNLRTSVKVSSWPIEVRYFWVLLWGYLDDHGKGIDNSLLIKADCFPLDPDITGEVIDGWLWQLTEAGVVARYTVGSVDYLQAVNWREHQKPPHPTDDVMPGHESAGATRRELHASRMKDAGNAPASLTPGLGCDGFGFGSGFEVDAHLTASVSFSDFWAIWPKKNNKKDAEKAWTAAAKRADPELIVARAVEYAAHEFRPPKQYVPYAGSWLRGDCWNDPMPEAPESEQQAPRQSRGAQALEFAMQLPEGGNQIGSQRDSPAIGGGVEY